MFNGLHAKKIATDRAAVQRFHLGLKSHLLQLASCKHWHKILLLDLQELRNS